MKFDLGDKKCLCIEMPILEYSAALDLQRMIVDARKNSAFEYDLVLILEHPSVFTLGRRGGLENLKVSRLFLDRLHIPIIRVERGGNITYHGPGQLVVYPIMDLNHAGLKIIDYVESLEEVMIRTASDWGIRAERNPVNRGIWVANNKLGSVGISVKGSVSFHGFALNVNPSLDPFKWINPCGLQEIGVTSMERECSQVVSMHHVRESITYHFKSIFGFNLVRIQPSELYRMIKDCSTDEIPLPVSRSS